MDQDRPIRGARVLIRDAPYPEALQGTALAVRVLRLILPLRILRGLPRRAPRGVEQIVRWRLADSSSLSTYYEQIRSGTSFDVSRDVGSIASPTLVVHGAEDAVKALSVFWYGHPQQPSV